MTIWVDADACPAVVRDIICRAAQRTASSAVFVANRMTALPASPYLRAIVVAKGFDVADAEIARQCEAGHLLVSADIALAAQVLAKGAAAINFRGEPYSADTIEGQLTMRDFMDTLRASGIQSGGPPPFSQADRQQFAARLDRWLATGHTG
ncbi:YaiI/YqxD family protein [Aquitalea sp. LB_tupeE]|uniref:YaiI/YqxD family protein n=1 Tax=Aquitalea sp. LB_tupeE TaxID=2748078 RepID=UPI0015BFEEA6|nr:YaiI/YqxD family protein [Aquitalea sp. LB_tupeE]NWK78703.1 YaiI/YqxD family protein [Aquitalea sp. LB_tupeE]